MNYLNQHIILFDGACILCNKSVQYIIKHDTKKRFQFASLQSEIGQKLLKDQQLNTQDFTSVIYLYDSKVYTKSTAAIRVFAQLSILHSTAFILMIFPQFIRNYCYDLLASNRHRIFKDSSCLLPTKELNERILKKLPQ